MKIDRKKIIERHNPCYDKINKNAPLSVGNGRFCFTTDFTGLQTFFDEYAGAEDAFPLCTMAEWGWHSYPARGNESELRLTPYNTYGRSVFYASDDTGQEDLFKRIRVNAHKFHLAKTGFELQDNTDARQGASSFNNYHPVSQLLSLWEGILFSRFTIFEKQVETETFVHPEADALYVKISSSLLKDSALRVTIYFPYGSHKKTAADFSSNRLHTTKKAAGGMEQKPENEINGPALKDGACCSHKKQNTLEIERKLDDTEYKITVTGSGFSIDINEELHIVKIIPEKNEIEFAVYFEPVSIPGFSQDDIACYRTSGRHKDSFDEAKLKCKAFWAQYWNNGGFIDFSGSTDARAAELERRAVLSQYLIAVQSRGSLPPAETGLTCNSWYGKFHLEMYFWHHAHFAFWNRIEEVKKALVYYKKILPEAKKIAASQGYSGARWPKMCDPSGKNTPSSVAVLLIWQQPHPVMFAELIARSERNKSFLTEYREIVVETAEFMKSFLHRDGSRYVLGPPYIPAQERHDPKTALNAAYELEYFRRGFIIADEWLSRLGEEKRYGEITENLSLPAEKDGVYTAHENCPNTFSEFPFYTDHPSMLAMYGVLNSGKIDPAKMSATLDKVLEVWDKKTFYGWDFPMMAMTACRLGRYKDAVDILLMDSPKNTYLENGHNKMTGDNALPLYLPGNGGLLLAIAMLAAGFEGKQGPLFPEGFSVNTEGMIPYV